MFFKRILIIFFPLLMLLSTNSLYSAKLTISKKDISAIGYKIYKNECGLNSDNLTHWNEGENFASLGIGHFIWYPVGAGKIHEATFPKLIEFLKAKGAKLPSWLANNYRTCPWSSRSVFYREFNSYKMRSLRNVLKTTMYLQTLYIIYRFNDKIPDLIRTASRRGTKKHVRKQMYRVLKSPLGLYALIDYSNFKGAGTVSGGDEWGLLQVLENMKGSKVGRIALYDFAKSAAYLLKRRVQRSANREQEEKWYPGWIKRLETYYQ